MKSLTLHLKILITILVALGVFTIVYERYVLNIPFVEHQRESLWTIDARLTFEVPRHQPVTAKFYTPAKFQNYTKQSEALIADKEYGRNIEVDQYGNRRVHYSVRRAIGTETLYYRLVLNPYYLEDDEPMQKGKIYRNPIKLEEADQLAADALVKRIRSRSSNTVTFISEAIKEINDDESEGVLALLDGDLSESNRVRWLEVILSQAHIPIERVNTLQMVPSVQQEPEIWIRSYIEISSRDEELDKSVNRGDWYYFNPRTAEMGLPADRIIWWIGNEPLLTVENARNPRVSFSVDDRQLTAISLAQSATAEKNGYLANSLYSLPISIQTTYLIMLMIPFGVLVVLLMRNVIGIQTLGTFTPVLIALAFRETELAFGLVLFVIVVSLGLSLRSYLEHLKLQMLSRLSVVLTFVVVLIAVISILSYKLGFDKGLSISLFPMVILTMTIERLSITWEERGGYNSLKIAVGTLISSSLAYLLMEWDKLRYFVFTFPGVLLILVAFMLAMGRYRGYRLTELKRFSALLKEERAGDSEERGV